MKELHPSSYSPGYHPSDGNALISAVERFHSWRHTTAVGKLHLFKLDVRQEESTVVPPVAVRFAVTVDTSTLQWDLWVFGKQVIKSNTSVLGNIPHSLQWDSLKDLLSVLDSSSVCPGFPVSTAMEILASQDELCSDILRCSTSLRAENCHMLLQSSSRITCYVTHATLSSKGYKAKEVE